MRIPGPISSRRPSRAGTVALVIIVGVVLLGGCLAYNAAYNATETKVVARVEHKERVCSTTVNGDGYSSQECKYLVFTDAATFQLTDIPFVRTNSSDFYGRIHEGTRYEFTVKGWRSGWTSSYQNIIDFKEVPS